MKEMEEMEGNEEPWKKQGKEVKDQGHEHLGLRLCQGNREGEG